MLVKAAINGGRSKSEHPLIPVTPDELASDVVDCLAAGAGAIHLHVRSPSGAESLEPELLALVLRAVKSAAPDAAVGISTGAWIVPDPNERFRLAAAWPVLPDFASVNFHEEGAVELAKLLLSREVAIEAGLCDSRAARILVASELASRCIRVLLEPQEQEIDIARETVTQIEEVLDECELQAQKVLHGTEATTWPLMKDAIKRGYAVRVGFEDTLTLSNGEPAHSNAELVAEALKLMIP